MKPSGQETAHGAPEKKQQNANPRAPQKKKLKTGDRAKQMALTVKPNNKKVSFSTVTVYSHNQILGDSPSVTTGVPVSLGWKRLNTKCYTTLNQYETQKNKNTPNSQPKNNSRKPFYLSALDREQMLLQTGYTKDDLRRSITRLEALRREARRNQMQQWWEERERRPPPQSSKDRSGFVFTEQNTSNVLSRVFCKTKLGTQKPKRTIPQQTHAS